MRIAFITPEFVHQSRPDGGLANYLYKISCLLLKSGHDPVIFVAGDSDEERNVDGISVFEVRIPPPFRFRRLRQQQVNHSTSKPEVKRQPYRKGSSNSSMCRIIEGLGLLREAQHYRNSTMRIASAFQREHVRRPFDLIQAASYQSLGGALADTAVVPLVVRVSSYSPLWRSAAGRKKNLLGALTDWLEVRQMQQAAAVFAPSVFLADSIKRLEGVDCKVVRTPFWIPCVEEDPTLYLEQLAGYKYLLFFGNLGPIKGADLLTQALPGLLEENRALHAVFAGSDGRLPDGSSTSNYIMSHNASFAERIHLLGCLNRERLYPVIRGAHLVVLPSRVDNYPNTCLKAQALGKIVIGTHGTSLDEMVEDGVTGFLAQVGSVDSLSKSISRALQLSEEQRMRMESEVSRLAAARDPQRDLMELLRLYESVLTAWHS